MKHRLKVLFVCAMNKQRSVTAERLYRNDARLEVRSAGVRSDANRRVSEADLKWADVVFVMEQEHKLWITMRFDDLKLPRIEVLDIPDEFEVIWIKFVTVGGVRKIFWTAVSLIPLFGPLFYAAFFAPPKSHEVGNQAAVNSDAFYGGHGGR